MAVEIKKVTSKADLKTFIRFNYHLYKDNPYSVPDLYEDMLDTFNPNFAKPNCSWLTEMGRLWDAWRA